MRQSRAQADGGPQSRVVAGGSRLGSVRGREDGHVRDVVCRMTGEAEGDGKGPSFWLGHRCPERHQAGSLSSPSRCLRRTHPPGLLALGRQCLRAPAGRSQSSPGPACSTPAAPPAAAAPSTARHGAQAAAGKVLLLPPLPRWPSNAPHSGREPGRWSARCQQRRASRVLPPWGRGDGLLDRHVVS